MKKNNHLTFPFLAISIIAVSISLTSCGSDNNAKNSRNMAEQENNNTFDNYLQQRDAQFLVDAAALNLEGILLGQLAQEKGTSIHVKELGKMMTDDHTTSQRGLVNLAARKNISIPSQTTDATKEVYADFNLKTGKEFDISFAQLMINEHEDAIEVFEKAINECSDSEIKNWATSELSVLRNHLLHAIECQNNIK